MAIQIRRGNYEDLDTSRLVQGEPFVTLDQNDGDYYVGVAIAPSNTVRLATWNNLVDIRETCEDARDEAVEARDEAVEAAEYVEEAAETHDPNFAIDWTTGELTYSGGYFTFWIDNDGFIHWGVENP